MRTFCTLFDKNYLYQGVALHESMVRHAGNFRLYALCMDSTSYALLARMRSNSLLPISVDELNTSEIAAVRARTTHGQFCWVCQPLVCESVLDRFGVEMVTYLESDSMFFSDPEVLFSELGTKSVSLVPHNFSSEFDNSSTAGKFCVQFNTFRNDTCSRAVLAYWKEWCFKYDKAAPLVYPGQTCLDDWPARFDCVKVIEHRGAGVAPWNVRGYELTQAEGGPLVDGVPVVFYHFHQYGRVKGGAHELGGYPLSRRVIDCFYRPYVSALRLAEHKVRMVDPSFAHRREYKDSGTLASLWRSFSQESVAAYLDALKRKVRGRYNVFPDAYFSERPQGSG